MEASQRPSSLGTLELANPRKEDLGLGEDQEELADDQEELGEEGLETRAEGTT